MTLKRKSTARPLSWRRTSQFEFVAPQPIHEMAYIAALQQRLM